MSENPYATTATPIPSTHISCTLPKPKKRVGRKASTLVRLYLLLRDFPLLSNKEIAQELGITLSAVYVAKTRLKKSFNISKYCLSCQVLSLEPCEEGLVCRECGRLFEKESIKINSFYRAPTNSLHFGNALGTAPDYHELRAGKVITSKAPIIQSQIKFPEDNFTKSCLEEFMRHIRTLNLSLDQTDALGLMLRKKIKDFKLRFKFIPLNYKAKQQIIAEILAEGSLAYPQLKQVYKSYLDLIESKKIQKVRRATDQSLGADER